MFMNKLSIGIIVFTSSLGLLAGFKANKGERRTDKSEVRSAQKNLDEMASGRDREVSSLSSLPKPVYPKSTDTLESIIEKGTECSLADMTLWLADASLSDIVAYWDFRQEVGVGSDEKRIIFHNLGRQDPYEALDYTKGKTLQEMVWWEWGVNDPELAFNEASATGDPEIINRVVNGIGQMQSGWLMANFERLPKSSHKDAFRGMSYWNIHPDHLMKLDFYEKQGLSVRSFSLNALAKEDPMAAYGWLVENDQLKVDRYGRNYALDKMLSGISETDPVALQKLIAQTPEGGVRRKMEDAFFNHLVKTDSDAAIEQAKHAESPKIQAKRLGEIGTSLLYSDFEKAFQIGGEIAAMEIDSLKIKYSIKSPNSTSTSGSDSTAEGFMKALLAKDPSRTMDTIVSKLDSSSELYKNLSDEMADQSVDFYADWVHEQNDRDLVNSASSRIASQYAKEGRFPAAAEWAVNGSERELYSLMNQWKRGNAEEAQKWVELADIEEGLKNNLIQILQR